MAGQVSPGIVLKERDLTTQTIISTQANTAAFVGSFAKGPVGTITNIASEKELLETFGAPNGSNYEDWFTAQTFISYGGQLEVVRIDDPSLKNAVSDAGSSSSDATKLLVADSSAFSNGDIVKIADEYFSVTAVTNTVNEKSLTVTRAVLGSSAASGYTSGSVVTKWNKTESATTTIVNEPDGTPEITTSETAISVTSVSGFTASTPSAPVYAVIKRTPAVGSTTLVTSETVKIVNVDSDTNTVVVERGQLGTSAISFDDEAAAGEPDVPTLELILLVFEASATSTSLSQAYPVITVSGIVAPIIRSSDEFAANYTSYQWKFAARSAGTWANNYKVAWVLGDVPSYDTLSISGTATKWSNIVAAPPESDDLHIAVLDASGNIVETFTYVSLDSSAKDQQGGSRYYVDVINRKSSLIYAGASGLSGNSVLTLTSGVDAYTTNVSRISDALDLFSDTEEITIDFVLCGGSLTNLNDQISKASAVIDLAATRKDCVAFVSPHNGFVGLSPATAQRDAILNFFDGLLSTSYAVFDSGYKYIYDRYNDTYRYVPCNGDIAGLCVQTSINSEDWFSPAGTQRGSLKSVVKLAYTPSKTDRDKLYLKRINPVTSFPGQGTVLFGDKTALATPSAFDRINVRRLFLAVEKRVNQLAKNVLFELNDFGTRSSFTNAVNSYLSEVQAKRGVLDYLVVCDETNNTADVIDRNEFVAEIYLKPSRSINFITITFVATRTGVSFSEVVGR